jgi:hypothetical protein
MEAKQQITIVFRHEGRANFQVIFDAHQVGGGAIQIVSGQACWMFPLDLIDSIFIRAIGEAEDDQWA